MSSHARFEEIFRVFSLCFKILTSHLSLFFHREMLLRLYARRYISSMNFKLNVLNLSLFHHTRLVLPLFLLCHDLSFSFFCACYHAALPELLRLLLLSHRTLTHSFFLSFFFWIDEITFCDVSLLLMFIGVEVKSINEISRI